jgi:hypothetical protein
MHSASYEIFLRTHQALAALAAYSIWRHLSSEKAFPRVYLYISVGLFLFMCIAQRYTHNGSKANGVTVSSKDAWIFDCI